MNTIRPRLRGVHRGEFHHYDHYTPIFYAWKFSKSELRTFNMGQQGHSHLVRPLNLRRSVFMLVSLIGKSTTGSPNMTSESVHGCHGNQKKIFLWNSHVRGVNFGGPYDPPFMNGSVLSIAYATFMVKGYPKKIILGSLCTTCRQISGPKFFLPQIQKFA